MPEGGLEGYYTDWFGRDLLQPAEKIAPGWATWDLHELIPYIDKHYRTIATRSGRAIAGLSMGGFGATSLAARRPDLFGAVGSFSGAVDTDYSYPYQNLVLYGTDAAFTGGQLDACIWGDIVTDDVDWRAVDPTYLAENLRETPLFIAAGNGQPGPYDKTDPHDLGATEAAGVVELNINQMNTGFVSALDAAEVPHRDYFYGAGTHSWGYWTRDLLHFLPVLARAWKDPKPAPKKFSFRSAAANFRAWGWHFADRRPNVQFVYLRDVRRAGFTAVGNGRLSVVTPPSYRPGKTYAVTAGGHRTRVSADSEGRLRFSAGLGPMTAQQTSFPDGRATPSGWQSVVVRIR
jgi:S-formylglutathione hydrolase FrmB